MTTAAGQEGTFTAEALNEPATTERILYRVEIKLDLTTDQ
jgi:hypothetical protein